MKRCIAASLSLAIGCLAAQTAFAEEPAPTSARIRLARDEAKGQLHVMIDGKEAIVYCYGPDQDLVHYYPVRSPSGKSMTVQQTEPFPHHRSFWFGDKVQLKGQRAASFYAPFLSRENPKDPQSPFKDPVRHVGFLPADLPENAAVIRSKIVWELDRKIPVMDELREMRIVPLTGGQYFLDLTFTVTPPTDDVSFLSDWVHYAWPFVRMNKTFSGEGGGQITNSEGAKGQAGTNGQFADGKAAKWVDYSNTVEGATEGLAIFSHPQNEHPHGWLSAGIWLFWPAAARCEERQGVHAEKGRIAPPTRRDLCAPRGREGRQGGRTLRAIRQRRALNPIRVAGRPHERPGAGPRCCPQVV